MKLREAAALAEDAGLRHCLTLHPDTLLTDEYQASDFAWMDMTSNTLEIIIGPIETSRTRPSATRTSLRPATGINSKKIAGLNAEIGKIVCEAGADVVIHPTGNARVIEQAYELTHADGKTILVGIPKKGDNISIYSTPLHFEKVLTGSHDGRAEPHLDIRYVRLMEAGEFKLDGLVTHESSWIRSTSDRSSEAPRAGRVVVSVGRQSSPTWIGDENGPRPSSRSTHPGAVATGVLSRN